MGRRSVGDRMSERKGNGILAKADDDDWTEVEGVAGGWGRESKSALTHDRHSIHERKDLHTNYPPPAPC